MSAAQVLVEEGGAEYWAPVEDCTYDESTRTWTWNPESDSYVAMFGPCDG